MNEGQEIVLIDVLLHAVVPFRALPVVFAALEVDILEFIDVTEDEDDDIGVEASPVDVDAAMVAVLTEGPAPVGLARVLVCPGVPDAGAPTLVDCGAGVTAIAAVMVMEVWVGTGEGVEAAAGLVLASELELITFVEVTGSAPSTRDTDRCNAKRKSCHLPVKSFKVTEAIMIVLEPQSVGSSRPCAPG